MRNLLVFSIVFNLFLLMATSRVEAKLLPRFRSTGGRKTTFSGGIGTAVRLRSDRKALNVNFSNLLKVTNVTYTLIYQTNGKDEGVSGTIDSSVGNSAARELLFGTCSHGVCRYHQNLSKMKLEIVSLYSSGKRTLRRFRIRV